MLRILHCLNSRLTDGDKAVSSKHRPRSTPHFSASGTHLCKRLNEPQGLRHPEGLGKLKKFIHYIGSRTRDLSASSTVGIATAYGLDDRGVGVWVPVGPRIFAFPYRPDRLWDPPSLLSNEYRRLFPRGVKQQACEADHSPPTGIEVKKPHSTADSQVRCSLATALAVSPVYKPDTWQWVCSYHEQ
jgi:hypothetical protein